MPLSKITRLRLDLRCEGDCSLSRLLAVQTLSASHRFAHSAKGVPDLVDVFDCLTCSFQALHFRQLPATARLRLNLIQFVIVPSACWPRSPCQSRIAPRIPRKVFQTCWICGRVGLFDLLVPNTAYPATSCNRIRPCQHDRVIKLLQQVLVVHRFENHGEVPGLFT